MTVEEMAREIIRLNFTDDTVIMVVLIVGKD